MVCYAFSLPPTAFTVQVNRATAETAQEVALAEGLAPLQGWVKHLIDRVLAEEFGAADLEFAWDADRDADPAQTATIAADYVKAGIKSINEVRAELGLPPVAGGEQPKIQTAQGLVPLTQSAAPARSSTGDPLRRYNENHYGPGPQGGQFAPADEGNGGETQAQEEPDVPFEEPPVPVRPPLPNYPTDPAKPPGPGYEWRGSNPQPGSPEGSWYNENTKETLRPDIDHPAPEGPHWDYKGPDGTWYRWFPDGRFIPKYPVA